MAKKKETPEEILHTNVREVLKTRQGKELVWEILGWCGLYDSSYSPDDNWRRLAEGKREIGVQLLALLDDTDPTIYPRLILSNLEIDDAETPRKDPQNEET